MPIDSTISVLRSITSLIQGLIQILSKSIAMPVRVVSTDRRERACVVDY